MELFLLLSFVWWFSAEEIFGNSSGVSSIDLYPLVTRILYLIGHNFSYYYYWVNSNLLNSDWWTIVGMDNVRIQIILYYVKISSPIKRMNQKLHQLLTKFYMKCFGYSSLAKFYNIACSIWEWNVVWWYTFWFIV
jgi:hypothetical protein